MSLASLFLGVFLTFSFGSALAQNCQAKLVRSSATLDRKTQITTSEIELAADPSCTLDQLAWIADPQNWALCNPESFAASFIIDETSGEKLQNAPTPGSAWTGVLFEKVHSLYQIPMTEKNVSFFKSKNLISFDIQKSETPNEKGEYYHLDYALKNSSRASVMGIPFRSSLDVDEGYINITKYEDGSWRFYGIKFARFKLVNLLGFKDPFFSGMLNSQAPEKIKGLLDGMADQGFACLKLKKD